MDVETRALQDAIFRSKVARARQMPIAEKLAAGAILFDEGMQMLRASLRSEHPDFTEEQIASEIARRLRIRRKLDDADLYRDAGVLDE